MSLVPLLPQHVGALDSSGKIFKLFAFPQETLEPLPLEGHRVTKRNKRENKLVACKINMQLFFYNAEILIQWL